MGRGFTPNGDIKAVILRLSHKLQNRHPKWGRVTLPDLIYDK